jgi:hypothetical protein
MRLQRLMHAAIAGVLAFAVGLAIAPPANAAKALNGRCGMHIGKLIRRNQGGSLYHFRIGPKDANLGTLRATTCRGRVRVAHHNAAGGRVGGLAWQTYTLKGFNRHTALLVNGGLTVVGCGGVAKIMVGAISAFLDGATEGIAFPATAVVAGTIGCGEGSHALVNLIPNGPDTLDGIRMVK